MGFSHGGEVRFELAGDLVVCAQRAPCDRYRGLHGGDRFSLAARLPVGAGEVVAALEVSGCSPPSTRSESARVA